MPQFRDILLHFRFKERNNINSLQKKTFTESLGGAWPPWPPWLRHCLVHTFLAWFILVLPLVHLRIVLSVCAPFSCPAFRLACFVFTFPPLHLGHSNVFCILPSQLSSGFLPYSLQSMRFHLLIFGLPRVCFPPTVICNIFLVAFAHVQTI